MGGFLWGLFDILLGLGITLAGLRMFFAVLPIAVFIVGGYVAGMAFYHLGDEGGFFDTSASILVGIAAGIALAVLSYFLWYAGALIVAGSIGAMIGSGIMAAFSSDADVLNFVVALIGAAVAILIAYVFNVPTWVVIVGTSMFGAAAVVLGAMLALDRVELDQLPEGPALAAVNHSWFWVLAWAVIAAIGIWVQYTTTRDVEVPEGRWTRLQPESYARVDRRST